MSQMFTFAELVNLAIGTPELGNVNFNALHFFLHSILDHLHLENVKKEITEDELDFLKPPSSATPSVAPPEPVPVERKSSSIFHQMHDRLTVIERQLNFLNDAPTTAQLLARSQGANQPTQDMWQMMQLKKKMEVNEEGMTKAMNTLQDLLNNIHSLKKVTDNFKEELGCLKDNITKLHVDDMMAQLQKLDEQAKAMEEIRQQVGQVKVKTDLISDFSDLVQWSSLCEMLTGKGSSEKDRASRDQTSRDLLVSLGQLPVKHEALATQLTQLEAQLKKQTGDLSEFSPELGAEVKSLLERMDKLQRQNEQGKESLRSLSDEMQNMTKQCEKLQKAMDRLMKNTSDIQSMRDMLEQLDITKADKDRIREEMNVKADKSALEAKVNHGELQSATTQLSEMMQDLLQKMSLQDKDWQKALEKLFTDMDCKLDRMALDPLSKQLEAVWRFVKKHLSEGPLFDADSAAGFKKQLFERVKCISCDRPVTMMTGPHMVTVRKAMLRPRPASANGYEYLGRQQRRDQEANEMSGREPPQACWQCQAQHQACTIKRMSRSQDFATVYPYGDPSAITYDNTEVDILGVNGVLYKGRVNSQAAERALALQKEFSGLKPPRPRSALRMERARSAISDSNHYLSPCASSSLRRIGPAATGSALSARQAPPQLQQQITVESVDVVVNSSFSQNHFKDGGGVTGT